RDVQDRLGSAHTEAQFILYFSPGRRPRRFLHGLYRRDTLNQARDVDLTSHVTGGDRYTVAKRRVPTR
ncbi:hypothetical protein, partial [Bacillus subtilis]|uniref:hypothetical protein n=1 Tax=Bacillus subtilis TaxID=1423 RepID=UPI003C18B3B8